MWCLLSRILHDGVSVVLIRKLRLGEPELVDEFQFCLRNFCLDDSFDDVDPLDCGSSHAAANLVRYRFDCLWTGGLFCHLDSQFSIRSSLASRVNFKDLWT